MNNSNILFNKIKCFIRLDENVWEVLKKQRELNTVYIEGHRIIIACPQSESLNHWLSVQPSDCRFVSMAGDHYDPSETESWLGEYTYVGISLSQADITLLSNLVGTGFNLRIFPVKSLTGLTITANPLVYTTDDNGRLLINLSVNNDSDIIDGIRELLKDHDFWYEMSDSLSVWRRGEESYKNILSTACEKFNLTIAEFNKIYNDIKTRKV